MPKLLRNACTTVVTEQKWKQYKNTQKEKKIQPMSRLFYCVELLDSSPDFAKVVRQNYYSITNEMTARKQAYLLQQNVRLIFLLLSRQ